MNTINETLLERENLAWITEREHDLASWLDEVDPELPGEDLRGSPSEVDSFAEEDGS